MIKVDIKGLENGKQIIEMDIPVKGLDGLFEEFFGDIEIDGVIKRTGNRYALSLELFCKAKLICDRSAEEYVEEILTHLDLSFVADTERFLICKDKEFDDDPEKYIHEDELFIDITTEVVEQLIVSLPMKRISPNYRDKEFAELHPERAVEKQEKLKNKEKPIDDRWAKLKNLKLN